MKSSEALKKARRRIKRGDSKHVCCALDVVNDGPYTAVQRALKNIFTEGRSLSCYWLERRKRKLSEQLNPYHSPHTAIAYRLAWIDWMIEGYEAVGD